MVEKVLSLKNEIIELSKFQLSISAKYSNQLTVRNDTGRRHEVVYFFDVFGVDDSVSFFDPVVFPWPDEMTVIGIILNINSTDITVVYENSVL